MRVFRIKTNELTYSSNVYLVLGEFNSVYDVNTLIDTGGDGHIVENIRAINTGVGKKAVDQIILTHNHFDHTGGIIAVKEAFGSRVMGFSGATLIDAQIKDGDMIKAGDVFLSALHVPEHSQDSIMLYHWESKTLFSGDTQLDIKSGGGTYSRHFYEILKKLLELGVNVIYPGHGHFIKENCPEILERTMNFVKQGIIN